jgi:nucleotide-binding universal stress UspA family protein
MFKHLLVPTDGSAISEAAIPMAVSLAGKVARKSREPIWEFHFLAYGTETIADEGERVVQATRQRADNHLAVITRAAAQAGVECDTVATNRAHPYEAIISIAPQRSCDLIVMASHGRGGMRPRCMAARLRRS